VAQAVLEEKDATVPILLYPLLDVMKQVSPPDPIWARPQYIARSYGIPRGSLYRLLKENPAIRTANLRGRGSARLVHVGDLEAYLQNQTETA